MSNSQTRQVEHLDAQRQMDLWSAFVDCYTSTATRKEVDKYLFGLFGSRLDPDYGRAS